MMRTPSCTWGTQLFNVGLDDDKEARREEGRRAEACMHV